MIFAYSFLIDTLKSVAHNAKLATASQAPAPRLSIIRAKSIVIIFSFFGMGVRVFHPPIRR